MRKLYLFPLFLLFPLLCFAQGTISGRVINSADNKPIPDASVFINNATMGTKAGADGSFNLYNVASGQYDIIVSVVGYETYKQTIVVNGNLKLPDIKMLQKVKSLRVVRIGDDPKWARKLRLFKDQFLGRGQFSSECTIVNPEVLYLRFMKKEQILTGMSDDFLEINNDALGYKLKYLISNFTMDKIAYSVGYEGSVLFEELTGTPKQVERWQKNRRKAYYGSSVHFFRQLVGNNVDADFMVKSFCIKRIDTLVRKHDWDPMILNDKRLRYDTLHLADYVHITDRRNVFAISYPPSDIEVYYYTPGTKHRRADNGEERGNRGQVAQISFIDDNLFFDVNGTILNPTGALFQYKWGVTRVADLLPIDYWPDKPDGAELSQNNIQGK